MSDASDAAVQKRVEALLVAGKNVYQPLYNYPFEQSIAALRPCEDRCATVAAAMGPARAGKRLLDVGCSLGFNTLYFAERGMVAHGIDVLERNVALCQEIQRYTPGTHRFWQAEFDQSFVSALAPDSYDCVFVFSVLHHIVEAQGVAFVQELLRSLFERVPVVFAELALRQETPPPGYGWDVHQPENELDLFALVPGAKITLLGHFDTHVGPVKRPLYQVTRGGETWV